MAENARCAKNILSSSPSPKPLPHINRPRRIKEGCTFFPIPSHLALNDKMKSVYKRGAEQKPENPNDLGNQISPEM